MITQQIASEKTKIAIDGGQPTLNRPMPLPVRWGDPEREQLSKMLEQKSLFYWNGPQTSLLIERFKKSYPFKYVMACSSGTAAIHIAIAAAGIKPGDEVITTPMTDMGTVIGILYQQGVPVFADLDPHRYNLDLKDVKRKITPRTKAIVAVHCAGNPCDLDGLKKLASEHRLILIEDCAQGWGACYRGQPVGTIGDIGCYSLNDFKQIGCGDGGIVASNTDRFGKMLQKFGDKGYDRTGVGIPPPEFLAPNYRISEPQSAVAAAQMLRLEQITEKRSMLGNLLTQEIENIPAIHPHEVDKQDRCSYWAYLLRLETNMLTCDRRGFITALGKEGVPASDGFIQCPIYQYPMFQNHNFFGGEWPVKALGLTRMDYREVQCPETEAILKDCVRIPLNHALDEDWMRSAAIAIGKVAAYYKK